MELSREDAEIPMPLDSVYGGGVLHGHGHGHMSHHHHHHTIIPPPPPTASPPHPHHKIIIPPSSNTTPNNNGTSTTTATVPKHEEVPYHNRESAPKNDNDNNKMMYINIRYRECQKNHAASMGGNATDGCGEFMPNGEEGTLEFFSCSVCNCHRNFHRREIEGEDGECCPTQPPPPNHGFNYRRTPHHLRGRTVILGANTAGGGGGGCLLGYPSPTVIRGVPSMPPHHPTHLQVGGGGTCPDDQSDQRHHQKIQKKRFRTKFSQEQKEKMLEFAERVGWKIQRQEEAVVQKFCQEVGIKRRVLKVWMHNNKHTFAKKNTTLHDPNISNSSFLN